MEVTGLPEFVAPHQKCTMKVKGAIHPEGKEIGYCWKVSPVMSKYDTTRYENGLNKKGEPSDGSFTYTFKDSLATYTIYCYAFATGYSSNTTTTYNPRYLSIISYKKRSIMIGKKPSYLRTKNMIKKQPIPIVLIIPQFNTLV